MMREYQVRLCVQRRLVRSAGDKPAGARVRSPVVWIAGWRETKTLKPIDKVSLGEITSHWFQEWLSQLVPRMAKSISKSPDEDNEAGELNKAKEVLAMALPTDEDALLLLLYPGEDALDERSSHITA